MNDETKAFHAYSLTTVWTWDEVSWNGAATGATPEFDPKVWALTAGTHSFTVYTREQNTWLDRVALVECPATGCAGLPDMDCR